MSVRISYVNDVRVCFTVNEKCNVNSSSHSDIAYISNRSAKLEVTIPQLFVNGQDS